MSGNGICSTRTENPVAKTASTDSCRDNTLEPVDTPSALLAAKTAETKLGQTFTWVHTDAERIETCGVEQVRCLRAPALFGLFR